MIHSQHSQEDGRSSFVASMLLFFFPSYFPALWEVERLKKMNKDLRTSNAVLVQQVHETYTEGAQRIQELSRALHGALASKDATELKLLECRRLNRRGDT